MKAITKLAWVLVIPFLVACQQGEQDETALRSGQETLGNPVVQAADGSGYSVQCLRSIAGALRNEGKAAMDGCKVNISTQATAAESATRGKFFTSSYAWIYYPPTYYEPSYYTDNLYTSYQQPTYDPFNDYSYRNNGFCSFVFGGGYNYNCYSILGYTNKPTYNYSKHYNSTCSFCLYTNHPLRCANTCYIASNY